MNKRKLSVHLMIRCKTKDIKMVQCNNTLKESGHIWAS